MSSFAYSVTSVSFARHVCLLSFVHCSMWLNVVEHRHEHDSVFEITLPRGSQECLNFSDDLERCVARKYMPMRLNWSARDIVLVCEYHRVPHFRDL